VSGPQVDDTSSQVRVCEHSGVKRVVHVNPALYQQQQSRRSPPQPPRSHSSTRFRVTWRVTPHSRGSAAIRTEPGPREHRGHGVHDLLRKLLPAGAEGDGAVAPAHGACRSRPESPDPSTRWVRGSLTSTSTTRAVDDPSACGLRGVPSPVGPTELAPCPHGRCHKRPNLPHSLLPYFQAQRRYDEDRSTRTWLLKNRRYTALSSTRCQSRHRPRRSPRSAPPR
jgi:hypothetical protein